MKLPELQLISDRLSNFVENFVSSFKKAEQRHWCKLYLSGLILDGERKSMQPMANRVDGADYQSIQQFVTDSPWDHFNLMAQLRQYTLPTLKAKNGILILDDVSLPKKGNHSVGVSHQYCGALGKIANCQTIVTWHYAAKNFHLPLIAQLYLPKNWTRDRPRMDGAGIPRNAQKFREKSDISLQLLDEVRNDVSFRTITFDAFYGRDRKFLESLDERNLHFSGQTVGQETFWDGEASIDQDLMHSSGNGRPRAYPHIADGRVKPKTAETWGKLLFSNSKNIRSVDLPLQSRHRATYVAKLVYETSRQKHRVVGPLRWLIIEKLDDGSFKYFVANQPENFSAEESLLDAHERWKVEQGYQQLKEELGLDHFEGRSWRGLHHHIALTFMAYDFLQLERLASKKNSTDATRCPQSNQPSRSQDALPQMWQ